MSHLEGIQEGPFKTFRNNLQKLRSSGSASVPMNIAQLKEMAWRLEARKETPTTIQNDKWPPSFLDNFEKVLEDWFSNYREIR